MGCKIEAEVFWQAKDNIMVFWITTLYSLVVCCTVLMEMDINMNTNIAVGRCNVWVGNNFREEYTAVHFRVENF